MILFYLHHANRETIFVIATNGTTGDYGLLQSSVCALKLFIP